MKTEKYVISGRWLRAGLLGLMAAGCTDTHDGGEVDAPGVPEVRPLSAQLVRAESCEDLLTEIHADALSRVDAAADLLRLGSGEAGSPGSDAAGGNFGNADSVSVSRAGSAAPATSGPVPTQMGAPVPQGPAAPEPGFDPNAATEEVAGPEGFSDTNRQVAQVDEADIVKVDGDGRFVYLLHGDRLVVLKSWPAEATAVEREVVLDAPLDGRPYEMFVKDGHVALFSSVRDSSLLRGGSADESDPSAPAFPGGCYDCYYDDRSFTKLTLIDLNGETPAVERELFFEGYYISSRRYDGRVRGVIRGGFKAPTLYRPYIEYVDPWGNPHPQDLIDEQVAAWKDRTRMSILATTLDHWLPVDYEQTEVGLVPLSRRCGDYYIPAPGLVSYGMTSIVEVDMLTADAGLAGAMILGDAAQVYSNTSTLLVAHSDQHVNRGRNRGQRTVLHAFDLMDVGLAYQASGFVDGRILNQFSMDERDGVVRVTTVREGWDEQTDDFATDNRLRTLRAQGDELMVIGETPNLGKPRETIRSTRFVDDMAYVVTFERIDPLVVVDIGDPENPEVLGQVEIPGFSSYMHPLEDGHLLTIGEFIDPITGGNRALQLQIFDVTEPTDPQLSESYVFPLGGNSLASQQHKAFNYYAEPQLLAFPYVNWRTMQSTLEVFHVSVANGFERLGSVDHVGLFDNCNNYPDGVSPGIEPIPQQTLPPELQERFARERAFHACPGQSVRRGVFIDDFVMSISYGGVLVHEVAQLTEDSGEDDAVARVDLDRPRYPDWEGNQFFGGGDFATPPRGRIAVPVPAVTASPPVMAPAPAPAPVPVDASGPVAGSPAEEPIVEEEDVEAAEQGVDDGQDEAWPVDAGVAEADGGSSQPQDAGVADSQ